MSYYGEKSAEIILKEVVISELDEFSGGEGVSSPALKGFTVRKVLANTAALAGAALFSVMCFSVLPIGVVAAIVIFNLSKFFGGDKLVFFIMAQAKKFPDKKISSIIEEQCVRGGVLYETKSSPRSFKPLIITLCSVFGAVVLAAGAYLFVPITLYEDTEDGCAVVLARTGIASSAEVKEYHDGKPVVGIKSGAYQNNFFLQYITLPDDLKYIEGKAFKNCSLLQEITIPHEVTELRGDTFRGCRSLKTVTLHDDITEIHAYCFMDCSSIVRIMLPKKITEIHESTFNNCSSLVSITIPKGVTRIAARAFYSCDRLSVVNLPDSLETIGSSAFRDCNRLTRIELPESCSFNERAFKDSPTSIEFREGVYG